MKSDNYTSQIKGIQVALLIDITVYPASGSLKIVLDCQGRLKCYLKAAPENGRANAELVKFLSKALGYTQDDVEIVSGHISRRKRLKIHKQLSYDQFKELLGLVGQKKLF